MSEEYTTEVSTPVKNPCFKCRYLKEHKARTGYLFGLIPLHQKILQCKRPIKWDILTGNVVEYYVNELIDERINKCKGLHYKEKFQCYF